MRNRINQIESAEDLRRFKHFLAEEKEYAKEKNSVFYISSLEFADKLIEAYLFGVNKFKWNTVKDIDRQLDAVVSKQNGAQYKHKFR
jgi:hypothetical protein